MKREEIEDVFFRFADCEADIQKEDYNWETVDAMTKEAFIKAVEYILRETKEKELSNESKI